METKTVLAQNARIHFHSYFETYLFGKYSMTFGRMTNNFGLVGTYLVLSFRFAPLALADEKNDEMTT